MPLSPAQLATLAADVAANANVMPAGQPFAGVEVRNIPHNPDGAAAVAWWYNQSTVSYLVWRTDAAVPDILDNVTWTNYTPNDSPPASTNTVTGTNDALLYNNRALLVQIKQANLLQMLQGRNTFNAAKSALRGGLNDATLNLPTGASGANRSGGWANIVTVLRRPCNRLERVFVGPATGVGNDGIAGNRGTATNPDLMGYEGTVSGDEIQTAWGG